MNSDKIAKLESSQKLKKKILGKGIWKNYSFIPPSMVLFVGILGLIYLFRMDYLMTIYSIPFIVIFALGTVWFKATKKYLVSKKMEESTVFLVCMCLPLVKKDKKTIYFFSTGKNRNNKYYLEKEKKDLIERSDDLVSFDERKQIMQIDETDLYITAIQPPKKSNQLNEIYWIIYSDNNIVSFLSAKYVN